MDDAAQNDAEWESPPSRRATSHRASATRVKVLLVVNGARWRRAPTRALDALQAWGLVPLGAALPIILGVAWVVWSCTQPAAENAWISHDICRAAVSDTTAARKATRFLDYAITDAWWAPAATPYIPGSVQEVY